MNTQRVLGSLLSLSALLAACSGETKTVVADTQVMLNLHVDPLLQSQLDELRASLWVHGSAGWTLRSSVDLRGSQLRWPLDIPIIATNAGDENAELEVVLEAFAAAKRIAQTRVATHFSMGTHTAAPGTLAACPNHAPDYACDNTPDCHGAACFICSSAGTCVPAGATTPAQTFEVDAGHTQVAQDDASEPGNPQPPVDSGVPGNTTTQPPTDAAVADAAVERAPDGAVITPNFCPAVNECGTAYPCVPTPLGYTCRGQFADWPMPDATPGAKTMPNYTLTADSVIDNVTGLEWQNGIPLIYPGCSAKNSTDSPIGTYCTRKEASAYCSSLGLAEHHDWRLPTVIELNSLFDSHVRQGQPGTTTLFQDTQTWLFISNSTLADDSTYTWGVNFYGRETRGAYDDEGQVRCVRGGKTPPFAIPSERYQVDSVADTVTDRATSLVWQRTVKDSTSLANAEAHCPTGMRLPTVNELFSLVDFTRFTPAIDTRVFPNAIVPAGDAGMAMQSVYWASTNSALQNAIDFNHGGLISMAAGPAFVRCVK